MDIDDGVVLNELSLDELDKLEEARVSRLEEAGIDESFILDKSIHDWSNWVSYFNDNNMQGKSDLHFLLRDQWSDLERTEFRRTFKPSMSFNKIYDVVKKIVGEQRKNKPDLIVRSLTGHATQEQINLRADLIRSICYKSQNDLVYQTAFKSALSYSYGAFKICIDYESPRSFNKVIRYELITNAETVAFDPSAMLPHKGDGNFCMQLISMSEKEFNATYPYVTNPVSYANQYNLLEFTNNAYEKVDICIYSVKEWFPLIIYKLSNGDVVSEEEYEELKKDFKKKKKITEGSIVEGIIDNEMPVIVGERQTQDYRIMQYHLLKNQILDFAEWPSRHLPIVFVDGDSYYVDGKQYTKSFIHEARDAQRFLNYTGSEIASEIKNRRREQWIGTPDNIIGQEQMWRNPEQQMGILLATPDPKTGQMPQKLPAWELSQSLLANFQRAGQDIREILGFSEAEQAQSRDISGKAKRERQIEASMSAYVFFDNLNQAVAQGGRIVNDLLPYVIGDEERSMVITKKDGKTSTIVMNKMRDGKITNALDEGEYDVEIDTGPSFAVQKEVALEFLQQTMQAAPTTFPLIADLYAKNLDIQYMEQISDRFKTLVPPEILAKEEGKPAPPKQPDPQQIMMAQEMKMQQQEMQIKEQKMQLEQKALEDRAVELQIRKEKHELEKAEMILKAHQMQQKMGMDEKKLHAENRKADLDFSSSIAKVLADIHKE